MNSDELFPDEAVQMDRPKLAWAKKHRLITFHSCPNDEDSLWMADFADEDDEHRDDPETYFFHETSVNGDHYIGTGKTEDEAIGELCVKCRIPLWNEE